MYRRSMKDRLVEDFSTQRELFQFFSEDSMNRILNTVAVFLLLLGFGVLLDAQSSNGTLVGTITDPS